MAGYGRTEEFMSIIAHEHEGATTGQKYGGLVPKKKPLISKDHERAFFDSADWALCKQGARINEKSTIAIETLRPKLERTPRQCLPPRRPTCISGGDHHAE
nr:cAMP-regulated phosphoprotein 19-related protein isoform 1 [Tanacetum cinerariifolium]